MLFAGDAAGFVNVPTLKGIHYAMQSGIFAARAAFEALKKGDTSKNGLAGYTSAVLGSSIKSDLYETRNMRGAFKSGFYMGGIKAGLMTLTKGAFPSGGGHVEEDAQEPRRLTDPPAAV